jgi:hypothetical protein
MEATSLKDYSQRFPALAAPRPAPAPAPAPKRPVPGDCAVANPHGECVNDAPWVVRAGCPFIYPPTGYGRTRKVTCALKCNRRTDQQRLGGGARMGDGSGCLPGRPGHTRSGGRERPGPAAGSGPLRSAAAQRSDSNLLSRSRSWPSASRGHAGAPARPCCPRTRPPSHGWN